MAYLPESLFRGSRQGLSLLSTKQVGNPSQKNTPENQPPKKKPKKNQKPNYIKKNQKGD
jgi:hypothetical protein